MSLAYTPERLRLPASLESQLHHFRRLVWTVKIVEAVAGACFGILVAYLVLFGLDRVWDTPGLAARLPFHRGRGRGAPTYRSFCTGGSGGTGDWKKLARLLSRKLPRIGDQLLGIIELAHNEFEQARSPALCEAAIREVAHDAERVDFEHAVPHPRHRLWVARRAFRFSSRFACWHCFRRRP